MRSNSRLHWQLPRFQFVANNAVSIAEAHFHPEAWFRAIYADETAVGFIMLHDENLRPDPRQADYYFLWRLMVDARYQGMGFGRRGVGLLVELVRSLVSTRGWPDQSLLERFYGFGYTHRHYLEIMLGVAMKTLSNYINHAADTPVNEAFAA